MIRLFLIVSFIILIFSQCVKDKHGHTSRLIVKNDTNYDISLKFYNNGEQVGTHKTISINKHDSIIFSLSLEGQGCSGPPIWDIGQPKDSVIIQFGNSYKLTHVFHTDRNYSPLENNSLNAEEIYKTEKKTGNSECTYYYYLTDEDIKRAQPL